MGLLLYVRTWGGGGCVAVICVRWWCEGSVRGV